MMSLNGLPLRVFLYTRDVDMRKSFNGLLAIVQSEFKMDVLRGDTFLFLSKRRDRVKAMWWDIDGLAIYMKRLERGSLQHPQPKADAKHVVMDATELNLLLAGIELSSVKRRIRYVAPNLIHQDTKVAS